MSRRLILLRHGETEFNINFRMQGHLDVSLTDNGIKQAERVAPVIAAERPFAIISSDLQRAFFTAQSVGRAAALTPHKDERLRETDMGEWAGLDRDALDKTWPGQYLRWRSDPLFAPPGGETRLEVAKRTSQVIRDAITAYPEWGSDDRPLVLVAHGGTIMSMAAVLVNAPLFNYSMFSAIGNTAWSLFTEWPHYYNEEEISDHPAAGGRPRPGLPPITPHHIWRVDMWNNTAHISNET